MNTPSHLILNLAILGRRATPAWNWPIAIGSVLPDVALFFFYGWAKAMGLPEREIWSTVYYQPGWQDIFAVGNSIPLALLGLGIALWRRWPRWAVLLGSMLLHHLQDLPVHHDDAHRHFVPLSNVRFQSPISYWDPARFGAYVALVEWGLVVVASVVLWRRSRSRWGRFCLVSVNVFYGVMYGLMYLHGGGFA